MKYYQYKGTNDFWFGSILVAKPDGILRVINDNLALTQEGNEIQNVNGLMEMIFPYLIEFNDTSVKPIEIDSESVSPSRVNHPTYYQNNGSEIECIDVIENFDFCTGNAIKYLWRCGRKKESGMDDIKKQIEDLEKAVWYINRKLNKLRKNDGNTD